MSRGVHIFYKLIGGDNEVIKYSYSGGDSRDKDEFLKAYDGILVIRKDSLEKEMNDRVYGIDYYQEKGCAATEKSHNMQVNNERGGKVDLFALKVASKVFRIYRETGKIEEENSIEY